MAIGTPTSIGTTASASATATQTHTTTAVVPSGALVIMLCGWGFATDRTGTMSGGGLTWTTDQTNVWTFGYNFRFGIFSAPAPSGLASSTVLTLTLSGNGDGGALAGCYVTGLDQTGSREDNSTGAGASGTAWNTGTATTSNADDLIIGGSLIDSTTSSTATGGASELFDFTHPNAWTFTVAYKIVSSTGSQSLTGTWVASANHVDAFAAYKGEAGIPWDPETNADETVRVNQSMLRF
jgi:hypothetical protein